MKPSTSARVGQRIFLLIACAAAMGCGGHGKPAVSGMADASGGVTGASGGVTGASGGVTGASGGAAGAGGGAGAGAASGGGGGGSTAGAPPDAGPLDAPSLEDALGDSDAGGVPPFVSRVPNYAVTGSWPKRIVGTPSKPIKAAPGTLTYRMVQVHDQFLAESCAIGDYNNDGVPDISSGRRWYEGPDFGKAHVYRMSGHEALPRAGAATELDDGVSDDAADYAYDVDDDGWVDIINVSQPETDTRVAAPLVPQKHETAYWYKNPGAPDLLTSAFWKPTSMHQQVSGMQHGLVDVDGDGRPEIYGACRDCAPGQTKGYYAGNWSKPDGPWTYHATTPMGLYNFPFGGVGKINGMGMGDINGDGRPDLLERGGAWLQQPGGAFPGGAGTGTSCLADPTSCAWAQSVFYNGNPAGNQGGTHMFAFDVDGDGLTDVVSAESAYGFGLSWHQRLPGDLAACRRVMPDGGAPSSSCFVKHVIMPPNQSDPNVVSFSEIRSVEAVDMDGDGLTDIVAGKQRLAQPYSQSDPDADGTPVLFVFKLVRETNPPQPGRAHFEPHLVNAATNSTPGALHPTWVGGSGVGTQLAVGQINPQTDAILDLCVASKLGLFVYFGQ